MRGARAAGKVVAGLAVAAGLALGAALATGRVGLLINETGSLPQRLFVTVRGPLPARGDYFVFRPPNTSIIQELFVKRAFGVAGDRVRVEAATGAVSVGGRPAGVAKAVSRRGRALVPIAGGPIPQNHYFARADHPDSYDSRYQEIGLVPAERVVALAWPVPNAVSLAILRLAGYRGDGP